MKKILFLLSFLLTSTFSYANDDSMYPFVDYVTNLGNGTYVVTFGYNNPTGVTQNLPVENSTFYKNYFQPNPDNRGQITTFLPGTYHEVFSINVPYGTSTKWNLTNKDAVFNTKNITVEIKDQTTIMPSVGQTHTYTLKYNINEGQSLLGSQLIDTLPAGTQFVSATAGGTNNNGVVTWNLGTLNQGAAGNVNVTVLVTGVQNEYKNKAYIMGSMSSASYRGYSMDVNSVPVQGKTSDSSYVVAFEDLKNSGWNDWDVNDFVVGMRERIYFDGANKVTKIVFDYEALARGSAFVNKFNHLIKLSGNSSATLVVKDSNGTVLPSLGFTNQAFNGNINIPVFPNTYNALPPRPGFTFTNVEIAQTGVVKGYTATLTITTDGSSNTSATYLRNSSQPYLINELNKQINIASLAGTLGNTQNVDNNIDSTTSIYGYFLDLGYRMPYDWKWPLEGPSYPIWKAFPKFSSYVISAHALNPTWYNSPDLSKVWTRRVVTDNFPFTGETGTRTHLKAKNDVSKNSTPEKHSLSQNYPNPFNPTTKISFSLPNNEFVSVKVFDMSGKEVAVLVNEEVKAGTHDYDFDGSKLSSGIYFYRINTTSFTDTKRMILVK